MPDLPEPLPEQTADQRTDQAADGDAGQLIARLRRHIESLATANRHLQQEIDRRDAVRRRHDAAAWLASLAEYPVSPTARPFLAVDVTGEVVLVEGTLRRPIASGALATALERTLGARRPLVEPPVASDPTADPSVDPDAQPPVDGAVVPAGESAAAVMLVDGPPVEVLEGPDGPPFVVVGGQRLAVRGLPLPHPVGAEVRDSFPSGGEIDLRPAGRSAPTPGTVFQAPLPDFLIIGAQKSATRWLRSNLGQHPDVYAAPSEIEFFNNDERFDDLGASWYRAQFGGWSGEHIVGEATPGYMMWRHDPAVMARRVLATVPDVRLIAILRNPIDRAFSAMVHHQKRERLPAGADLVSLVRSVPPEDDNLGLIAGGWYAKSLQPYVDLFGEQVLVLLHDDLDRDPRGLYTKAASHVGASPGFVPPQLERVRFSNQQPAQRRSDPLTPDERTALWEYFRDDVAELEVMLDRSLAQWAPPA